MYRLKNLARKGLTAAHCVWINGPESLGITKQKYRSRWLGVCGSYDENWCFSSLITFQTGQQNIRCGQQYLRISSLNHWSQVKATSRINAREKVQLEIV